MTEDTGLLIELVPHIISTACVAVVLLGLLAWVVVR